MTEKCTQGEAGNEKSRVQGGQCGVRCVVHIREGQAALSIIRLRWESR